MHCQCCLSARARHTNCRIKHSSLKKTKKKRKKSCLLGRKHALLTMFTLPKKRNNLSPPHPPPAFFPHPNKVNWDKIFFVVQQVFYSLTLIASFLLFIKASACWLLVLSTILMAEETLPVCHCKDLMPCWLVGQEFPRWHKLFSS